MSGEANTSYVRKRGKVDFTLDSGDDSDEWGGAKGGEEEESSSSSDDSADEDWAAEEKPRRKRATKAEMAERRAKADAEAREKALRMRGGTPQGKRRGRKPRPPEEKVRIADTKAVAATKKVRNSPYPLRIRPKRELQ